VPPPLISTLNDRQRRAFPIIQGGVSRGLAGNEIQRVLRLQNLGINNVVLQRIIRAEKGVEIAGARLRSIPRHLTPDPRRLPDALTRIRRAFSFTVKVSGFDLTTGEDFTQFVAVALDDVMTRGEIENLALGLVERDRDRYGFAVTDVILQIGVKAGVEGTVLTPVSA